MNDYMKYSQRSITLLLGIWNSITVLESSMTILWRHEQNESYIKSEVSSTILPFKIFSPYIVCMCAVLWLVTFTFEKYQNLVRNFTWLKFTQVNNKT